MAGTPPQTLEDRVIALEKAVIPTVAAQTPKISTRVAGLLTALLTGLTYAGTYLSGVLTPTQSAGLAVVVAGLGAYITAEET